MNKNERGGGGGGERNKKEEGGEGKGAILGLKERKKRRGAENKNRWCESKK